MALADIFAFLARHPEHTLVRALSRRLSLHFVPMLNPDGAARFQRHNAAGIDVNRVARRLATPEGRALKAVHDRMRPEFGFNLHDQSPRFRSGTPTAWRPSRSWRRPTVMTARSARGGARPCAFARW